MLEVVKNGRSEVEVEGAWANDVPKTNVGLEAG